MRTLFLTSSGLNEKTMVLFWKCIGKEPINTKAILVPCTLQYSSLER